MELSVSRTSRAPSSLVSSTTVAPPRRIVIANDGADELQLARSNCSATDLDTLSKRLDPVAHGGRLFCSAFSALVCAGFSGRLNRCGRGKIRAHAVRPVDCPANLRHCVPVRGIRTEVRIEREMSALADTRPRCREELCVHAPST